MVVLANDRPRALLAGLDAGAAYSVMAPYRDELVLSRVEHAVDIAAGYTDGAALVAVDDGGTPSTRPWRSVRTTARAPGAAHNRVRRVIDGASEVWLATKLMYRLGKGLLPDD